MALNGISTRTSERRRVLISWLIRLVIAFTLSVVIVLAFFASGAVSR
jgi:hypothetical protein